MKGQYQPAAVRSGLVDTPLQGAETIRRPERNGHVVPYRPEAVGIGDGKRLDAAEVGRTHGLERAVASEVYKHALIEIALRESEVVEAACTAGRQPSTLAPPVLETSTARYADEATRCVVDAN